MVGAFLGSLTPTARTCESQRRSLVPDDDLTQAKAELDEVLLNVEQSISRVSRAIRNLDRLAGTTAELTALLAAEKQLKSVRKTLVEASLSNAQQRLM